MSADNPDDTDRLVADLVEATKKAQDLAIDVKKSLRADRQVGRSVLPDEKPAPDKRRGPRRRSADRRKRR